MVANKQADITSPISVTIDQIDLCDVKYDKSKRTRPTFGKLCLPRLLAGQ